MDTIQKQEEHSSYIDIPYPSNLFDESRLTFEIKGLSPERSYEDRDVYLNIKSDAENVNVTTWIRGENAIDLGMKLIEHGKFALESNMINHQLIHSKNQFKKYLDEGIVEEVEFTVIDQNPPNYGEGFRLYRIKPYWVEGMAPEYNENFEFECVIYWSTFDDKYADQLDYYTHGCSYSMIGYDRELELNRFNEEVRLMSGG